MVKELAQYEPPSLLGGPLYRMAHRLGLVWPGSTTTPFGVALGLILWIGLITLASFQKGITSLFSMAMINVHARLLLVIPLLFLGESALDSRLAEFFRTIVRSEVVPPECLPRLRSEIARVLHHKNSWVPDGACWLTALLLFLIRPETAAPALPGSTEAVQWYWIFCMTIFRFLLLRWLWRIGIFSYILQRTSKLELNLIPTHPDRAAGLGYLEMVQISFLPLVAAISVDLSASLAEEISTGRRTLNAVYPMLPLILLVDASLFVGPLFVFSRELWISRRRGLAEYMEFASRYVNRFDRKWLRGGAPPEEELLGTGDLQSLADLKNSVATVLEMRLLPTSLRTLAVLAAAAIVPILPLFLLQYPITVLLEKLLAKLFAIA